MQSSRITLFLFGLAAVLLAVGAQLEDFGNEDISDLLNDRELVQREIRCVVDSGECDELGNKLKAAIPEILSNNCGNCSSKQAANARLLTGFIKKNYPRVWTAIQNKYINKA